MSLLSLRIRQKSPRVNRPLLRQITRALLEELLPPRPYQLCIHLVSATEMARVNQQFLHHSGPTDVITFDHSQPTDHSQPLEGEIYICLEVARTQARAFRTTWQSELARYVAHGILHLYGYCDLDPGARRKMKRVENRLVTQLSKRFLLSKLALPSKVSS